MSARPRVWLSLALLAACGRALGATLELTPACTPANLFALDASLPSLIGRILYEDPKEGFEAARFLAQRKAKPIRLAVSHEQGPLFPTVPRMSPGHGESSWAYFDPDDASILINHSSLHFEGNDELALIKDPKRLEHSMRMIAGTIVHEVSHARDASAVGSRLNSLETELIAFYRQAFYLLDTAERGGLLPGLLDGARVARRSEVLEERVKRHKEALRRSGGTLKRPPELAAAVARHNEEVRRASKLLQLAAYLLRFERGNESYEGFIAEGYRERRRICASAGAQQERRALAESRDLFVPVARRSCEEPSGRALCLENRELAARLLPVLEGQLADLSSPEAMSRICGHFEAQLAALREEANTRRARSRSLLAALKASAESGSAP